MNKKQMMSRGDGMVTVGTLEPLSSFAERSKQVAALPDNMPVLTCPVAAKDAHRLRMNYKAACFGFGQIQQVDGVLMTIRFQLGDLQFFWVAEMTDPEIWAAVDMWKQAGRVPIVFNVHIEGGVRSMFCMPDLPEGTLRNEVYRHGPDTEPTASTWHGIASLVTSGNIERGATTDLEGIPLRHVFANALLTERLKPFIDDQSLVKKPSIVWAARR